MSYDLLTFDTELLLRFSSDTLVTTVVGEDAELVTTFEGVVDLFLSLEEEVEL